MWNTSVVDVKVPQGGFSRLLTRHSRFRMQTRSSETSEARREKEMGEKGKGRR